MYLPLVLVNEEARGGAKMVVGTLPNELEEGNRQHKLACLRRGVPKQRCE